MYIIYRYIQYVYVYIHIYIYTLYVLSGNIIPKKTDRNYIYTVRDSSDVQEWKSCSKTVQKKSKSVRKALESVQ